MDVSKKQKAASIDEREDGSPEVAAATILASASGKREELLDSSEDKKLASRGEGTTTNTIQIESVEQTVTHERRWEIMYARLKVYKEEHGNCLVPNRFEPDRQLGSWVSAQRRQFKIVTSGGNESAGMTPERAQKLRELGFEWSTSNPRNVPWETRYSELQSFVASYGHAEVPMRWEENRQLSNWVSKQRHQYKLMKSSRPNRLTAERVNLLNEVGFVWEASRRRLQDGESEGTGDEDEDDGGDAGESSSGDAKSKGVRKAKGTARSRMKTSDNLPSSLTKAKKRQQPGGVPGPATQQQPAGMPAPGFPPQLSQAQAMAMAAAGQSAMLQAANIGGLWAAMTAAQGVVMPQQAAGVGAGGILPTPNFFMPMMPFGVSPMMTMMQQQQVPGWPFAQCQQQSAATTMANQGGAGAAEEDQTVAEAQTGETTTVKEGARNQEGQSEGNKQVDNDTKRGQDDDIDMVGVESV